MNYSILTKTNNISNSGEQGKAEKGRKREKAKLKAKKIIKGLHLIQTKARHYKASPEISKLKYISKTISNDPNWSDAEFRIKRDELNKIIFENKVDMNSQIGDLPVELLRVLQQTKNAVESQYEYIQKLEEMEKKGQVNIGIHDLASKLRGEYKPGLVEEGLTRVFARTSYIKSEVNRDNKNIDSLKKRVMVTDKHCKIFKEFIEEENQREDFLKRVQYSNSLNNVIVDRFNTMSMFSQSDPRLRSYLSNGTYSDKINDRLNRIDTPGIYLDKTEELKEDWDQCENNFRELACFANVFPECPSILNITNEQDYNIIKANFVRDSINLSTFLEEFQDENPPKKLKRMDGVKDISCVAEASFDQPRLFKYTKLDQDPSFLEIAQETEPYTNEELEKIAIPKKNNNFF